MHVQSSAEDKDTGQNVSAIDCYFMCQVRLLGLWITAQARPCRQIPAKTIAQTCLCAFLSCYVSIRIQHDCVS